MRSDYYTGVVLVVIAAITYSTAGLFTKGVEAGAWSVIFWRGLFAAGFMFFWTVRQREVRRNFRAIGPSGWSVAIIGALGTAAFIPAFKLTTIANVSLIYAVAPMIAALLAWLLIGERAPARTLIGSVCAFFGVAIIVSGSVGSIGLYGDLLALAMTTAMASIMVIYRKHPHTPGPGPSALQSVLLFAPAIWFGRPFDVDPGEILVLAAFGLLFAIASVTLAEGAKKIPSSQAALLSALETPLAPLFALLVFFEVPNAATFLGGSIVFLGVMFCLVRPAR